MARFAAALLVFVAITFPTTVLSDVPLGECHECEVTCFEDCSLKYDREIIQMDMFLQTPDKKVNRTAERNEEYTGCVKDNCPCKKAAAEKPVAKGKAKALKLMVEDKKKKGQCAVGEMSCASKCGQQVVQKDAELAKAKNAAAPAKVSLLQRDFPLHSVKINVFAKGAMNLDQCMKYCLSATCGCADAAGFANADQFKKAIEANAAIGGGVKDTPKSPQYRPAKIEECGKGMIGKKVASDLYIKLEGGPGGMYEVCSKKFLSKLLGPSGDVDGMTGKCKSGASDDAKFGCLWDSQKDKCVVGFSPILTCQVQYHNDPTL